MYEYAIEVLTNSLKMHKCYDRKKKLNKEISQLQQAIDQLSTDEVIAEGKVIYNAVKGGIVEVGNINIVSKLMGIYGGKNIIIKVVKK